MNLFVCCVRWCTPRDWSIKTPYSIVDATNFLSLFRFLKAQSSIFNYVIFFEWYLIYKWKSVSDRELSNFEKQLLTLTFFFRRLLLKIQFLSLSIKKIEKIENLFCHKLIWDMLHFLFCFIITWSKYLLVSWAWHIMTKL